MGPGILGSAKPIVPMPVEGDCDPPREEGRMQGGLHVPAEVREAYRGDGAVCTRGVVSPDAAGTLLQQALAAEKTGDRLTDDMNLFEKLAGYWDCVDPLPALAAQLTGSKRVRFYNDHLFIKRAGASAPTRWH